MNVNTLWMPGGGWKREQERDRWWDMCVFYQRNSPVDKCLSLKKSQGKRWVWVWVWVRMCPSLVGVHGFIFKKKKHFPSSSSVIFFKQMTKANQQSNFDNPNWVTEFSEKCPVFLSTSTITCNVATAPVTSNALFQEAEEKALEPSTFHESRALKSKKLDQLASQEINQSF